MKSHSKAHKPSNQEMKSCKTSKTWQLSDIEIKILIKTRNNHEKISRRTKWWKTEISYKRKSTNE